MTGTIISYGDGVHEVHLVSVCRACGLDFDPSDAPAPIRGCPSHGIDLNSVESTSASRWLTDRLPVAGTHEDHIRLGLVSNG